VIDLACGSGRLTFPLAQRGLEVIGVDLSDDMLALLRQRGEQEAAGVRERITAHQGNMAALDDIPGLPDHDVGLVTLAATSIVLLHRSADRRQLFSGVARRLRPGGRLAFDVFTHDLTGLEARPERYSVLRHRGLRGSDASTLLGQRFEQTPAGRTELVNMQTEEATGERRLTTTRKAVFVLEELSEELSSAGLQIVGRPPRVRPGDVVLLECARTEAFPLSPG
jgi:SAM-dependent methyltransferase